MGPAMIAQCDSMGLGNYNTLKLACMSHGEYLQTLKYHATSRDSNILSAPSLKPKENSLGFLYGL